MKFTKQQMQTGNKRLRKLTDLLDTVPDERFDYVRWVGSNWQGKSDLSCGTTACALGWATTIPAFRKLGLRLLFDGFEGVHNIVNINKPDECDTFKVASDLFRISYEDSVSLFAPGVGEGHFTARQVAKKIRNYTIARQRVLDSLA